jgi:hypothetical protein
MTPTAPSQQEPITRLCLQDAVSVGDLSSLAWELDWDIYEIYRGGGRTPFEKVWRSRDEASAIHYVEDPLIGLRYLLLRGANQDGIAEQIRESIGILGREALSNEHQQATGSRELERTLRQMAVAAVPHRPDPDWLARFRQAGIHDSSRVRRAVVLAAVYTGWRGLAPLLADLAAADPDQAIRSLARQALESLNYKDWQP